VNWLLIDAKRSARVAVRRFTAFHRLLDVELRLPELGPARFVVGSMAEEFEDELMEWLPEGRREVGHSSTQSATFSELD
jgi:hypothetical protein